LAINSQENKLPHPLPPSWGRLRWRWEGEVKGDEVDGVLLLVTVYFLLNL